MFAVLKYERGTIKIEGNVHIPFAKWDNRSNCYRALAYKYRDIVEFLKNSDIDFEDHVLDNVIPTPYFEDFEIELRDYQAEAVERWMAGKKGIVVLPTGAGKTYVALDVIRRLSVSTLVVVPTLALVDQWKDKLTLFGKYVGEFTGRRKELKPITVTTYDSAYVNAELLGDKFLLIVFDEVHHLPAEAYRQIAEMSIAPYRLGLTAVYERADGLHALLPDLVGGVVYEMKPKDLAGTHLANYVVKRLKVPLTEKEKELYDLKAKKFKEYIISRGIKLKDVEDFKQLVMMTGLDREAYEALKSWDEARKIAFNSKNKLKVLKELLEKHKGDKIIIFTRYNDLVYAISKIFLIPAITHKTDAKERKYILDGFKKGKFKAIVSSQVLDEGIDVPDANVGIIVSGTGSSREFVQRLGRILRPARGKDLAILYELVSKNTSEVRVSKRRRKTL